MYVLSHFSDSLTSKSLEVIFAKQNQDFFFLKTNLMGYRNMDIISLGK